jgi:hypothetical protein
MTKETPYRLLYGYQPKGVLDVLIGKKEDATKPRTLDKKANSFLENLQMHRESARLAIARAQDKQASTYNKGRKMKSFEWIESKGDHAKLVQRALVGT